MDKLRQIVASPTDLGGKGVLVLNDVDLIIPATQIEVNKEDLTYRYRTLRTKSATKVPTGNGQASIHMSIPFTDDTLLSMHRLLVEMRNSPFMYVDNRYIRESMVADWPYSQNMALTLTGVNVSSMPNASNAFIMELDATWFNYFPYMHNFLFREEWQTNWIRNELKADKTLQSFTIGWNLDPDTYQRIYYPNPVETLESQGGQFFGEQVQTFDRSGFVTDKWSLVQERFMDVERKRTIYEMEQLHPGVEFDLLPIPGNMKPSNLVAQPKDSRIYVRYINFLQRDALMKGFGIDVEADIIEYEKAHNAKGLKAALFQTGRDADGLPIVVPLHSNFVPRSLRHKWIRQMMAFNHGVKFHFHGYHELRLPQKWTDNLENKKNQVVQDLFERLRAIQQLEQLKEGTQDGDPRAIPVMGARWPKTSDYGIRNHPKTGETHFHNGVDFGAPRGTPLYMPEQGSIIQVEFDHTYNGNYVVVEGELSKNRWYFCHMDLITVQANLVDRDNQPIVYPRGTQIGTVGSTGRSTGPHLHLTIYPRGGSNHENPLPYLDQILVETQAEYNEQLFAPTPTGSTAPFFDYSSTPSESIMLENEDQLIEVARKEAQEDLELTDEEVDALQELLDVLSSEGWQYYDADTTVTNVWKKLFSMEVRHSGLDTVSGRGELPEPFRQEGIILTSISGGLSHLVAHIPILGHEFPTHQHLGSIEPEYQLEFAILDDQSDLEGLSAMGQLVQGMRSTLQSNSRKFRPVMDSWCLAVDTFITRLLGTYHVNDLRALEADGLLQDIDLRKRSIIARTYDGTVPGNPGLSTLHFNIQETNPYEQEFLVSTAPVLQDKEEARRSVLNAVYKMELLPEYKDLLFPLFIAQKLNANLSDPNRSDFGKFTLRTVGTPLSGYTMNAPEIFLYEGGGQTSLLIKQNDPNDLNFLRSLGLEVDYHYDANQNRTGFIQLDPNEMDTLVPDVQTTENTFDAGPAVRAFFADDGKQGDLDTVSLWAFQSAGQALKAEVVDELVYSADTLYDISKLVLENPVLASLPVEKLMEYYIGIAAVIGTGNRMFAEQELGGLDPAYYFNELYGLPFRGDMWKSWQMFLEEWIKVANKDLVSSALQEFKNNSNAKTWTQPLSESMRTHFAEIANGYYGLAGSPTAVLWNDFGGLNLGPWLRAGQATFSESVDVTQGYKDKHEEAIWRLVAQYMRSYPLSVSLPDNLKARYSYVIGDLIGGASIIGDASTNERGKTPVFDSLHDAFYRNAYSCGNITYDFITTLNGANPIWQTAAVNNSAREHAGVLGASTLITSGADLNPITGNLFYLATGKTITQYQADSFPAAKESASAIGLGETLQNLYTDSPIGAPINSPFEYPVDQGVEQVRVHYIKTILAAMADDILGDYRMLQMLGLEHFMFRDENRDYTGRECYPDLDLPAHPYYQSITQTYPDFYMWNIYEDGGAFQPEQLNAIQEGVNFVVKNAYDSMQRLSKGEAYDERTDTLIPEVSVDSPLTLVTQLTPEGTDGQRDGSGAMADPYAPEVAKDGSTLRQRKEVEKWKQDAADGGFLPNIYSGQPADYIDGIRLANAEGLFGVGGGVHYPRRAVRGTYDQLKQQYLSVNQMFGSSEGYMNRAVDEKNTPEIARAIEGTNLARPPTTNHTFDLANLQQLSRDSSKDLISQKMSLKRAFPTFKLYFVEEDEFETRFINFDDFYSYNAIKEISITQSRKNAADVAVISLQNVSGSLDGTKRNAIADLDYFTNPTVSTSASKKLAANEDAQSSVISGDAITTGTQSEQPFGAVVLRTGLNVQLRLGFSNDPNCLQVMLNGRVVDVVWNKTGDLAEILIQSFGSELEQVIKGTSRDGNNRTFYTTHELLGSMMLEPEVVHFGRWEFGQQFQIGEAKDHKLDFTEYAREGWLGRFTVTSWFSQFVMNHPYIVFGGAVALTAAGLFPYGRVFQFAGKIPGAGGLVGRLTKTLPVGKNGYRAIAVGAGASDEVAEAAVAVDTGLGLVDVAVPYQNIAGRAAGQAAIIAKLRNLAINATRAIGGTEYKAIIAARVSDAVFDISRASNLDDMAAAAAKLESFIQTSIFKSKWMSKPWVELTRASFASAVGWKPLGQLTNLLLGMPLKAGAAAFLGTVTVDLLIQNIMRPLYRYTVGGAQKFFARTRAQLFLTPQDDNLFPPHPKDYMTLDEGVWRAHVDLALHVASMLAFADNDPAITASRFIYPDRAISKKVNPDDCHYQLVNTTIWEAFHEMSIRHPGWIYAARPYGNKFRYTMFFGVPSQRYWARGASNAFITRANDLKRYLDNKADEFGDGSGNLISEFEFESLYGAEVLQAMRDEIEAARIDEPGESIPTFSDRFGLPSNNFNMAKSNPDLFPDPGMPGESIQQPDENAIRKNREDAVLRGRMQAIVLQEYLRAIQLRFEPFRRYHLLSSERDIVWNGIMGSENAVVNAVDVTYFPSGASPRERNDEFNTQIKTAVFKAHSFIPEHKLRMAPVRWYNCTGYGMAMRYAMGELCNHMKDMYRGEIIVLGNPRIRPWDVGIVIDTYNAMVGPIEVEQVVHTYSHETGYLTEIKPSALVYANEISGWPMIEAMKLYALAVQDIHNRYAGIKAADTGTGLTSLANVAEIMALPAIASPRAQGRFKSFMDEKYNKIFGAEGATLEDLWGAEPPPDLKVVDDLVNTLYKNAKYGTTMSTLAGLGLTLGGSVLGTGVLLKNLDDIAPSLDALRSKSGKAIAGDTLKIFLKNPLGLAAGGALLAGTALVGGAQFTSLVLNQVDFPGMAFLLGSTTLFLQCLRNDALIVVPLTKNGNPIVSGLAINDPQMLWKSFRGTLNRWADETIQGTSNMLDLYKRYGAEVWERITEQDLGSSANSAVQSFRPDQVGASTNQTIIDGLTGE